MNQHENPTQEALDEGVMPVDVFMQLASSDVLPPRFSETFDLFNQQQSEETE